MAVRQNFEIACLQFEHNGLPHPRFFARGRPELFCKPPDHWFGFRQKNVLLKSVLDGDGFGRPVWDNQGIVDAKRKLVQALPVTPEIQERSSTGWSMLLPTTI